MQQASSHDKTCLLPHRAPHCTALFPYTTLFRSMERRVHRAARRGEGADLFLAALRAGGRDGLPPRERSEEHTSELQSRGHLVCRLLLENKKTAQRTVRPASA